MSVVDFRGKKLQMITAYNSYHTTQFFNSAVSKQNNKLYWKNRRPPAALHGHVVEYVQHLSVSVSRVSDSSTNSSYSTTQLALRLFLSGDFFSKRTLKKTVVLQRVSPLPITCMVTCCNGFLLFWMHFHW